MSRSPFVVLIPAQILIDSLPESATEEEVKKLAEEKGGPVSQSDVTKPIMALLHTLEDLVYSVDAASVKLKLYQQEVCIYLILG